MTIDLTIIKLLKNSHLITFIKAPKKHADNLFASHKYDLASISILISFPKAMLELDPKLWFISLTKRT